MKHCFTLFIPVLLFLMTGACMDQQDSDPVEEAVAEMELTFTNAETGAALDNFSFLLILEVEELNQPVEIDNFSTDVSGFFSTPVYSQSEDTITKIIAEYEVGGEIRSVEEEVDLRLRYEEPYNSASVHFEVDVSTP